MGRLRAYRQTVADLAGLIYQSMREGGLFRERIVLSAHRQSDGDRKLTSGLETLIGAPARKAVTVSTRPA
jgi:hypothetical protein